jgi:alpha-tubulin suppressor-like RCC1 family protein
VVRTLVAALMLAGCSFSVGGSGPIDAPEQPGDTSDGPIDGPSVLSACKAVEVSAMSAHNCARMENGDVWCWGINGNGEVGVPFQLRCGANIKCNPTPNRIAMPPATRLGVAEEHSCAIAGPQTFCWGRNTENQLGDGTAQSYGSPTMIAQRANATQIGGGLVFGCSLHGTAVRCSGGNLQGEVGDATSMARATPVNTVPSGTSAITTGYSHSCAIEGSFLYCWGWNMYGQIDSQPGANALSPRIVQGVSTVVAAAAGYGHTCAALMAGDLRCWGDNDAGQLGVGDKLPHPNVIAVPQVTGIVQLSAGADHTCARTPAGTVYCWGEQYTATPAQVTLPRPAVSIASGSYHDCFALDDGSVYCVGMNPYGQLGQPLSTSSITTPARVTLCP